MTFRGAFQPKFLANCPFAKRKTCFQKMPKCKSENQKPLDRLRKGCISCGRQHRPKSRVPVWEMIKVVKWEPLLLQRGRWCRKEAKLICCMLVLMLWYMYCWGLASQKNPFVEKTMRLLCFEWPKPWCCSKAWEKHPSSERHQQSQVAISAFVEREKVVSERKRKWSVPDKKTMCQEQLL